MYYLWKTKRICNPSDYWNMSIGNKLILKSFIMKEQEERYKDIKELQEREVPILPVSIL
ncbi:hypothetical protein [Clostridium rectalis]|uniref:hypothetical protein n=1 Tax=Clostridium rectalis TaxID=2040295 RepID=UPI0013DDFAD0|nr:hypothetical protein [Clostridium rectalis]